MCKITFGHAWQSAYGVYGDLLHIVCVWGGDGGEGGKEARGVCV